MRDGKGMNIKSVVSRAVAMAWIPLAAQAGNFSFLHHSPISYFTQADLDLLTTATRTTLDATDPNAEQAWDNPHTGASGLVQAKGQFTTRDGTLCKRLRVISHARKLEGEATYIVCKDSARGWILNADATPGG